MAATTATAPPERSYADVNLDDDQIEELLARATARRQEKSLSTNMLKLDVEDSYKFPKLNTGKLDQPYVSQKSGLATVDSRRLVEDKQRKQANGVRKVTDPTILKKLADEKKTATAGHNWYDLPRTNLTPELKRDLQLIKMRGVLDPHRHYKKDGGKMKAPEFSQVGTIIEGPTEFFTGRVENKKRKKTFVEEVLAGEQETGRFKRRYGELQEKKTSGKMAFYKALKEKRRTGGVRKFGK